MATASLVKDDVVKAWSDMYESEMLQYQKTTSDPGPTESETFAQLFHALVHSSLSLSMTLARLEHDHALAVHRTSREAAASAADISHLKETQKREFRDWISAVSDQVRTKNSESGIAPMSKSDSAYFMVSSGTSAPAPPSGGAVNAALQESFTITLGSQMKHTHNLRLVAADAVRLCSYEGMGGCGGGGDGSVFGQEEEWLPRRLQTAMSLYSHNLSGLVLLTSTLFPDDGQFGEICGRSTEYHFPSFRQQLGALRCMGAASEMKCGDFYLTRHSNLCEVHVVFHMIADAAGEDDDDVPPLSSSEKVNSRHPVVMGLRNVLKTASTCGVTTLTLPLLLTPSLSEEMTTVGWCLRRAELVFKCVKGFMMEVASSGGGEDLKTLQFVVPKDIDQDVFLRLAAMLASIFRSSNPIKGSNG